MMLESPQWPFNGKDNILMDEWGSLSCNEMVCLHLSPLSSYHSPSQTRRAGLARKINFWWCMMTCLQTFRKMSSGKSLSQLKYVCLSLSSYHSPSQTRKAGLARKNNFWWCIKHSPDIWENGIQRITFLNGFFANAWIERSLCKIFVPMCVWVLLYLVTVDNLGQIVCTSCIQTAANRVICLVSQHWNGFESFFFNWSCSTKAPVHLYQYEHWAIFERIICVLHTNDSK